MLAYEQKKLIANEDKKILDEIKQFINDFKNAQDVRKKAKMLITIADRAAELSPKKGRIRDIFSKQIKWKNLIYLKEIIPYLAKTKENLLDGFFKSIATHDLPNLEKIIDEMISYAQAQLKKYDEEETYNTIINQKKPALEKQIGELQSRIKALQEALVTLDTINSNDKNNDKKSSQDGAKKRQEKINSYNQSISQSISSSDPLFLESKIQTCKIEDPSAPINNDIKSTIQSILSPAEKKLELMQKRLQNIGQPFNNDSALLREILKNIKDIYVKIDSKESAIYIQNIKQETQNINLLLVGLSDFDERGLKINKQATQSWLIQLQNIDLSSGKTQFLNSTEALFQDLYKNLQQQEKYENLYLEDVKSYMGDIASVIKDNLPQENKKTKKKVFSPEEIAQAISGSQNSLASLSTLYGKHRFITGEENKKTKKKVFSPEEIAQAVTDSQNFIASVLPTKNSVDLQKVQEAADKIVQRIKDFIQNRPQDSTQDPPVALEGIYVLADYSFDLANIDKIISNLENISIIDPNLIQDPMFRFSLLQIMFEAGEAAKDLSADAKIISGYTAKWDILADLRDNITHKLMDTLEGIKRLNNFLLLDNDNKNDQIERLINRVNQDLQDIKKDLKQLKNQYDEVTKGNNETSDWEELQKFYSTKNVLITPSSQLNDLSLLNAYFQDPLKALDLANSRMIISEINLSNPEEKTPEQAISRLKVIIQLLEKIADWAQKQQNEKHYDLACKFAVAYAGEVFRLLQQNPSFKNRVSPFIQKKVDDIIKLRGEVAHDALLTDPDLVRNQLNEYIDYIPHLQALVIHIELQSLLETHSLSQDAIKENNKKKSVPDVSGYYNAKDLAEILTKKFKAVDSDTSGHYNTLKDFTDILTEDAQKTDNTEKTTAISVDTKILQKVEDMLKSEEREGEGKKTENKKPPIFLRIILALSFYDSDKRKEYVSALEIGNVTKEWQKKLEEKRQKLDKLQSEVEKIAYPQKNIQAYENFRNTIMTKIAEHRKKIAEAQEFIESKAFAQNFNHPANVGIVKKLTAEKFLENLKQLNHIINGNADYAVARNFIHECECQLNELRENPNTDLIFEKFEMIKHKIEKLGNTGNLTKLLKYVESDKVKIDADTKENLQSLAASLENLLQLSEELRKEFLDNINQCEAEFGNVCIKQNQEKLERFKSFIESQENLPEGYVHKALKEFYSNEYKILKGQLDAQQEKFGKLNENFKDFIKLIEAVANNAEKSVNTLQAIQEQIEKPAAPTENLSEAGNKGISSAGVPIELEPRPSNSTDSAGNFARISAVFLPHSMNNRSANNPDLNNNNVINRNNSSCDTISNQR